MPEPYKTYNEVKDDLPTIVNGLLSQYGALNVEQTTSVGEPFALYMGRVVDPDLAITTQTAIDDSTINVDCPNVAPTTDYMVCLKEGDHFYQGKIISVTSTGGTTYDVDLDKPLDFAFTVDGGCSLISAKMNVDGSTTPVTFSLSPGRLTPGLKWDVHGFTAHIIDTTVMDDSLFGGGTGLTRGITIRAVNGMVKNLANIKVNGDFGDYGFDVEYVDKAPAGLYGLRADLPLMAKYGTTVSLTSEEVVEDSDLFNVIVYEDLTGLSDFHILVRGHIVSAGSGD